MWWIALHLPRLSFESWLAALPPDQREQPAALMNAREVVMCNASAQRLGVEPGLQRITALALAPQLRLGRTDAARDRQAITCVAHVALAFTPAVCFPAQPQGAGDGAGVEFTAAPHTVLLQVQASLRCFGGPAALLQRLRAALRMLGCTVQLASAPTARGAAVLACLADVVIGGLGELHCADLPQLERLLDPAPLCLLRAGREHRDALDSMGLRTFGALRRLPRQALIRRFGQALLDEIDTVLGRCCDPPPAWVTLPDTFEASIELQTRADTTDQVLHGAQLLVEPLLAWARAHQARVRCFTLFMHHEPRHRQDAGTPPVSELSIALAEPSCDADHLSVLLRERLARLQLPAPTLELRLRCADVARGAAFSAELFASARGEREGLVRLIERLQARLGPQQVQRLTPVSDHRPDRHGVPERSVARAASAPRPIWSLQEPQPLPERRSRPLLDGQPLQLLCGPERVESGWWNAPSRTERDYFIAQTPAGALVWIYRARLPLSVAEDAAGWFVHGWFA